MANIDIKKLFVKVAVSDQTTGLAWSQAVEGKTLDSSKIYFLDNGTLYVPFVGKYYGVADGVLDQINADIAAEVTRAKAAENALGARLDIVEGDESTEGSIKKAVKDAVDGIMGGSNIQESLDTIKEISEWINDPDNSDGIQGFLGHVADFEQHVKDANTRMDGIEADIEANKNAADEKLSKFINGGQKDAEDHFITTFPADVKVGNDADTIGQTPVTNFVEYITAQNNYDNAQVGWLQTNSKAIADEKTRAEDVEAQLRTDLTSEINRATQAELTEANTRADSDTKITTQLFTGDNNLKSGSEADHYNLRQLIGDPANNESGTAPVKANKQEITWVSASADDAIKVTIGEPTATSIETVWSAINGVKYDLKTKNEDIANKIDTIEASVGLDENGGHIATSGRYSSTAATVVGEIAAVETQVAANEDAIDLLNGADTEVGSVAHSIKTTVESLDADVNASDEKTYVSTSVTEVDGKLTATTVSVTYGDYTTPSNGVATVEDTKAYVDKKIADLAVTAEGDDYVSASVNADDDNKHVIVATNVKDLTATAGAPAQYDAEGVQTVVATQPSLIGEANSLADASDIAEKVKTYIDGKIAIESARSDANTLASIKVLDATVEDKDDKEFVTSTTVQTDGKLTSTTVDVVYAAHNADASTISDGIVDAATLNTVIGDLWEEFVAQ